MQAWELLWEVCASTVTIKEWELNDLRHGVDVCKWRIVQSATCIQLIESQRVKKLFLEILEVKSCLVSINWNMQNPTTQK